MTGLDIHSKTETDGCAEYRMERKALDSGDFDMSSEEWDIWGDLFD